VLGINTAQFFCFLLFWGVHFYFIKHGTESIRWLQMLAAPFLLLMGLLLLAWAYTKANGFGPMLATPSAFAAGGPKAAQFWPQVAASLTAMVGFWATLALNICDFTRFSRSQRDQVIGQTIGLPLPMALFSFIGVAVTSATVVIFGKAIWQPTDLAAQLGGAGALVALAVVCICTLTVNMAANVVSPSYDFSNLWPSRISFAGGGFITALIGVAIFPWRLLQSAGTYIYAWLVGYSALLGPIAGIMIADYFIVRKQKLVVDELFHHGGRYDGTGGWNLKGVTALVIGVAPNVPGFLHSVALVSSVPPIFDDIFTGAWFVGFFLSAIVYVLLNLGAEK